MGRSGAQVQDLLSLHRTIEGGRTCRGSGVCGEVHPGGEAPARL